MAGRQFVLVAVVACGACSGANDKLSGGFQKGPFINGSTVTVSVEDAQGNPTGTVYNTFTTDDRGAFSVDVHGASLVSIEGTGFYYNEVTGALSEAAGTLRGFHGGGATGYINVVTHLAYLRELQLMRGGASFPAARSQAEAEVRAALQVGPAGFDPGVHGDDLDLLGGDTDANAYLFAVSAVLSQAAATKANGGAVEPVLQELVDRMAADLADDGQLDAATVTSLVTAQRALDTEAIKAMLARRFLDIGATATVPDLDRMIDSDGDGVMNAADNCPHTYNADQAATANDGRGDACSPASIAIASGDEQRHPPGITTAPLVVTVLDPQGDPVAGYPIDFAVTTGGAALSASTAMTDDMGNAQVTLTLGALREPNVVAATVELHPSLTQQFHIDTVVGFWPSTEILTGPPFTVGGVGPNVAVTADFDGDGQPDVAIADQLGNVSVSLNRTAPGAQVATFTDPVILASNALGYGMATADFNGDSRPDLVVLPFDTGPCASGVSPCSADVRILFNTTPLGASSATFVDGGVVAVVPYGYVEATHQNTIAIADLDRDGLPDIAIGGNPLAVLLDRTAIASTTATFTATSLGATSFHGSAPVVAGDFDRDGVPDLAVGMNIAATGHLTAQLWINHTAQGASTPSFTNVATNLDMGVCNSERQVLAAGDVDADGALDLVVMSSETEVTAVLYNTTSTPGSSPTFTPAQELAAAVSNPPSGLGLTDLDGDGQTDIVFLNGDYSTVSVFTNAGARTFAPRLDCEPGPARRIFWVGGPYRSIDFADVNADGKLDIVAGNSGDYDAVANLPAPGVSVAIAR